jgi:hypothetical protein
MVKNMFSHILICMLDEVIQIDSSLAFKQKNLPLPPKVKSSNPKGKQYPYDAIL